jgi:hypothetical protein
MAISFFNKTQTSASEIVGEAFTTIAKSLEDVGRSKSMKPGDLSAVRAYETMAKLFETTKNIVQSPRAVSTTLEQPAAETTITNGPK